MPHAGRETRHLFRRRSWVRGASVTALLIGSIAITLSGVSGSSPLNGDGTTRSVEPRAMLDTYCVTCHNQKLHTAGLALDVDVTNPGANAELWEKVIAKLRAGSMPPPGRPRPDTATYLAVARSLEADIDRAWAVSPSLGRISAVHRLNRAEYNNAVRDLFALDVDVKPLLPGDETDRKSVV